MFKAGPYKKYRTILIAVGVPLLATGIQWLLWPFIKPFSWFIYWPAISLCIIYGNFEEGVLLPYSPASVRGGSLFQSNFH